MIISAFYSGLRGGKMVSDGLLGLLEENGLLDKVHSMYRLCRLLPAMHVTTAFTLMELLLSVP